jgi:hypothetical protein
VKRFVVLALLVVASAACARTFKASTTQPNPIKYPPDVERKSDKLVIQLKDMDLPRAFLLRQTAYFAVVSRDRLRFHIRLTHKWDDYADVRNWDATLVDDQGRTYKPEAAESRATRHLTRMWDVERRTAVWNSHGDVVKINNDAYKDRTALESVDTYKGVGDLVFKSRDMFTRDVKKLTLTMKRGDMTLQFVWTFSDDPADWPAFDPNVVAHESGDYEDDFETAAVCTDLEGRPMPNGGGCFSGSDPGRGR